MIFNATPGLKNKVVVQKDAQALLSISQSAFWRLQGELAEAPE